MLKKEDICFVINPLNWYENMYPSGILFLSGYLKKQGFDNIILDSKLDKSQLNLQQREDLILNKIKEINPRIVCFSSTNREFNEVVRLNQAVKKINDKIITIVGGAQPTYRYGDFIENGFDFVVLGEGEVTLFEFVREVMLGTYKWNNINGLVWRNNEMTVVNSKRSLMSEEEVNSLGVLPYEKIDLRYFNINLGTVRGLPLRGALLLTSRGCPYDCSYCGCNLIFGRKLRFRSLEVIEAEIKILKENFNVEAIWIVDDTFTINRSHVIEVAKILKKYNLIWGCQTRVDSIDEELISFLHDAGCIQLDFGVESGSQRILDDIIGKKTKIEQVIKAFSLAKKYKFRTLANFMIGLPTETYKDLEETKKLVDLIDSDVYVFAIATPLPGTRLYDMVGEKIIPQEYPLLDFNGGILTDRLNKSEIKNLGQERFLLHKKYSLRSIRRLIFSYQFYALFFKLKNKLQRLNFLFYYFVFKFFKLFFGSKYKAVD